MKEIWKKFSNIQVSNFGNIKTVTKTDGTYKGYQVNSYLYCTVSVGAGKYKSYNVDKLVATLFCKNDDVVNNTKIIHKDGDGTNNKSTNLKWVSKNYITDSKPKYLTTCYKVEQYDLKTGMTIKVWNAYEAELELLGFSKSGISQCCRFKMPYYKGFGWRYEREHYKLRNSELLSKTDVKQYNERKMKIYHKEQVLLQTARKYVNILKSDTK